MKTTSMSDFRKDITIYLDTVSKEGETLIVEQGEKEGVVLMPLTEYSSLMTTNHELSSRKNEMRLDAAIEKMKKK
ncbi:MAG: type II toxin-antitoxin system Phd/YefM family antitoxin [Flavobacteriaceae bacterium]|jgi:antitoxin YefM|nr:type II toxin-antitoxin system Phd/YefM family antitoxin [Flavobacteriaceae bacterium]